MRVPGYASTAPHCLPAIATAAAGDACQAVLQMPRGNLEAVRPRGLVLPALAAALDAGDYAGMARVGQGGGGVR